MKLRNSLYFIQLDGEAGMDLHDFEARLEKDKLRQILIKEHSAKTGMPIGEARAAAAISDGGSNVAVASSSFHGDDEMEDVEDMLRDAPPRQAVEPGLPRGTIPQELMDRINKKLEQYKKPERARGSADPPPLTEKEKTRKSITKN